ncbi:TPR-like protein [Stereum hirsutum FP-91666 SS1]|uniref:TPR-like protein n=1 Tax=Stereum hirsutum (strain FP-91666) TaxID=721885 RepID=UPI000440C0D0|nr:TPR-like protein [Stereum hirsutum FP-91666 SS1]EIM86440.1 TPR-like protein [Stereum hirsutum FP-91666 SS1]
MDRSLMKVRIESGEAVVVGHGSSASDASYEQFEEEGEVEDVEKAINDWRQAFALLPPDDRHHAPAVRNFAYALMEHFKLNRATDTEEIDESVQLFRTALALVPFEQRNRYLYLSGLAAGLHSRFECHHRLDDLEEAYRLNCEAWKTCPSDDPNCSIMSGNLTNTLCAMFKQHNLVADLDATVDDLRNSLLSERDEFTEPSISTIDTDKDDEREAVDATRVSSLRYLTKVLLSRFDSWARREDLDDAIYYLREMICRCSSDSLEYFSTSFDLLTALHERYDGQKNDADRDECISLRRIALATMSDTNPERPLMLQNLGVLLESRYDDNGVDQDLEDSVRCYRDAQALWPSEAPERTNTLRKLSDALRTSFILHGREEDLQEALKYGRAAIVRPPKDADDAMLLMALGNSLTVEYDSSGKHESLMEAIQCFRDALSVLSLDHDDRHLFLTNLGNSILDLSRLSRPNENLEEATELFRDAVVLCPPGHTGRFSALVNYATAIHERFDRHGNITDLEEVINIYREALTLFSDGNQQRFHPLVNLGNAVLDRFEQQGRKEDIDEVVALYYQALPLRPTGHSERPVCLTNLADALHARFDLEGRLDDLEQAVCYGRECVALCDHGHPRLSLYLNNLGTGLYALFKKQGKREIIDESISLHRSALHLRPVGHPDRSWSLNNLVDALNARFSLEHRPQDIEEAVSLSTEAEAIVRRTSHHTLTNIKVSLAESYLLQDNVDAACQMFEKAASYANATLEDRYRATYLWATSAYKCTHSSTLKAYECALVLQKECIVTRATIEIQHRFLARSDLERAVEMLEQGRGQLWSKMRDYRHPLDDLRGVDPELAQIFNDTSSELDKLARSSASEPISGVSAEPQSGFDKKATQQRLLSEKWDETVQKIREIDGFSDFLRIKPYSSLQAAAVGGPVIIVNMNSLRCDAFILRNTGPPTVVPPSSDLPTVVTRLSRQMIPIKRRALDRARYVCEPVVKELIRFKGDGGLEPRQNELPRIWWCLTSMLGSLPIHAAGPYVEGQKNLSDYFISSYTPTLSSLIASRRARRTDPIPEPSVAQLLAVGQSKALPQVNQEFKEIHNILGDSVHIQDDVQATPKSVVRQLKNHPWVHFACHGSR